MRFPLDNLILVLSLILLASCTQPVSTKTKTNDEEIVLPQGVTWSEIKIVFDSASKVLRSHKMKNLTAIE